MNIESMSHLPSKSTASIPMLLLGEMHRVLPLNYTAQLISSYFFHKLQKIYPKLTSKLSDFYGKKMMIIITDLNIAMLVRIDKYMNPIIIPKYQVDAAKENADCIISAAIFNLLKLIQGEMDGDTMFFSKDLSFEGNTEIVVAVRNALESISLDIEKDFKFLGYFYKNVEKLSDKLNSKIKRLSSILLSK